MGSSTRLRLGVALEGAGWHPAAWREQSARPAELFTGAYWTDLVRTAEAGLLDFATIEDTLALQSGEPFVADARTDEVRGRLDALLIASRVAPVTAGIGLIPTVTVTHTEPFHVSKAIATLDYTSVGRAGWQAKVSGRPEEARHFGRRTHPGFADGYRTPAARTYLEELFEEAADAVEAIRRLWDSWEDDAEIREVVTDRFLDAAKVHRVDFEGRWFSVRGPSITPRPPQGQPVVAALAHSDVPYRFAAGSADVVFVTPADEAHARAILAAVADAERAVSRSGEPLRVFADLVVFVDLPGGPSGAERLARLDARGRTLTSDTQIFTGSAEELADRLAALGELGYAGARLRPGVVTDDLPVIVSDVTDGLRRRGLFHDAYEASTLRGLLGLSEDVPNRYAAAV
jgi:alkanesulfonate monooxygenase SsuD/methylene tetrahydromethanopterin reductase-like flavin-dependent oxidoreductase (luciferase family)